MYSVADAPISGRRCSHATFWDGKRKGWSEATALWQVVNWAWRIHKDQGPLQEDEVMPL